MSTLIDIGLVKDAAWRCSRRSTTSKVECVKNAMSERLFNHKLEVLGLKWLTAGRASGYVGREHSGQQKSPGHTDNAVWRRDEAPLDVGPHDDLAPPLAVGCEDTKIPDFGESNGALSLT
jgi:hypothetical protein